MNAPWPDSFCHVGLVVPDLDATMARYRDLYGLNWASVQARNVCWRDGDGAEHEVDLRYTMSTAGPIHVEVIENAPGSIWASDGDALHHICYWVDDLQIEADRLRSNGYRLEATRVGPAELNGVAYFMSPDGLRVEPKPEASRAPLEGWLDGGEYNWPPVS